jgi:hypothetical protein
MIWLSLFLSTYLIHIAEEYFGGEGYSTYLFKNYGVELSQSRFLVLQSLGLSLMAAGLLLAGTFKFPHTMLVVVATVVISNALIHVTRSIIGARYEPGLVSAIGLWLPLGVIALYSNCGRMTAARFWLATLAGLAISGLVEVITRRGGKLVSS